MAHRLPFHSAGGTTLNTVSSCVTVLLSGTLPNLAIDFIYTGEQGPGMALDYTTLFSLHLLTFKQPCRISVVCEPFASLLTLNDFKFQI